MKNMKDCNIKNILENNPIISAVNNDSKFLRAITSESDVIIMLKANLKTIEDCVLKAHLKGKKVFVHIDMAEGLGRDETAVSYLSALGVDGIISTKTNLIKYANELNMYSIQRVFILDSHSIETSLEAIKVSKCDMVEIMPGIMPKIIKIFSKKLKIPVIAGGLITEKNEVIEALKNGACAISTSNEEIWNNV